MKDFQDNCKVFDGKTKFGNINKGNMYIICLIVIFFSHKMVQLTRKRLTALANGEKEVKNSAI